MYMEGLKKIVHFVEIGFNFVRLKPLVDPFNKKQ